MVKERSLDGMDFFIKLNCFILTSTFAVIDAKEGVYQVLSKYFLCNFFFLFLLMVLVAL